MNGLRVLAFAVLALAVGLVAYQMGLSQGLATTLPAGAAPVAYYGYHTSALGSVSSLSSSRSCSSSSSSARCAPLLAATVATDRAGGVTVASASKRFTASCTARSPAEIDLRRPAPSIPS